MSFGGSGVSGGGHRLFFAIRPDAVTAAAAIGQGSELRQELGTAVRGRPLSLEHLHVTQHWLGDYAMLDHAPVELARAAGDSVQSGPFEVMLDRVATIGSTDDGGAVVLSSSDRLVALRAFQRELGVAMAAMGLRSLVRHNFKPHMTLLYAGRTVQPRSCPPVRWTVREFLLIHSLVGQTTHLVLGRWPLRGRQMPLGDW